MIFGALWPPISRPVQLAVDSAPFWVQPVPAPNRGLLRLTRNHIFATPLAVDPAGQLRRLHISYVLDIPHGAARRAILAEEVRRCGHTIGQAKFLICATAPARQLSG